MSGDDVGQELITLRITDDVQEYEVLHRDRPKIRWAIRRATVREHDVTSASFTGLGALSRVVLGYFDWERKEYRKITFDEQVEVVSLLGNVALDESGQPSLHPHMVIARADAAAFGGHVLEAVVRPVIELVVTESPTYLQRRKDTESGLALIRL